MNGLHGSDDAELAEAGNIGGIDVLSVFDAPTEICFIGMRFECFFVNVEDFAIGAVADGVDAELETVGDGDVGGFANGLHLLGVHAAAGGEIRIRFEHPGAAGAEGAVGDNA